MHRVAQIVNAITSRLASDLEPIGVRVFAMRTRSIGADHGELPAVVVDYGDLERIEANDADAEIYCGLDITASVVVASPAEDIARENALRYAREVHRSLMESATAVSPWRATLDLGFVVTLEPLGWESATSDGGGASGSVMVSLRTLWRVVFSASVLDIGDG